MRKLTLEECRDKIYSINKNIEIINCYTKPYGTKGNSQTYCDCKCLIDGYEWTSAYQNLSDGKRCPVCSKKVLHETNNLASLRPDLTVYLKNKEDAYNNFPSSKERVLCICPICDTEKIMPLNNLARQGFSCTKCSDNISIPEKFMGGVLSEIGVDFAKQEMFSWSDSKKYDFYIPSLNIIIETHGEQHYKNTGRGRSLEEEQKNDVYKFELALLNDVELDNYIIVDCRKSTLEYLKENIIKQLEKHFDLSNMDWLKIWENSQKSIVPKIWEYWNDRKENETTCDISKIFKINRNAIANYLKIGTELGKCFYDPQIERKIGNLKANIKTKLSCSIPVLQYTMDMEFMKEFLSIADAGRECGIKTGNISQCCRYSKNYSHVGGFIWRYKSEDGIVKQDKKETKF
jgi:hypothetical protein